MLKSTSFLYLSDMHYGVWQKKRIQSANQGVNQCDDPLVQWALRSKVQASNLGSEGEAKPTSSHVETSKVSTKGDGSAMSLNEPGSLLLKDGSTISRNQSEGVIRVLNFAIPKSAIPTQSKNGVAQEAAASGFIISNPSKSARFGVGNEGIVDLSKVSMLGYSEEDLELHEDWDEEFADSSSNYEQEMKELKRGQCFPNLQDSNEIQRRKTSASTSSELAEAQEVIRKLQKEIEEMKYVQQYNIPTQLIKGKQIAKKGRQQKWNRFQKFSGSEAASSLKKSKSTHYVWKVKKEGNHSDSEIVKKDWYKPTRMSISEDEAVHMAYKEEKDGKLVFDQKSKDAADSQVFCR